MVEEEDGKEEEEEPERGWAKKVANLIAGKQFLL